MTDNEKDTFTFSFQGDASSYRVWCDADPGPLHPPPAPLTAEEEQAYDAREQVRASADDLITHLRALPLEIQPQAAALVLKSIKEQDEMLERLAKLMEWKPTPPEPQPSALQLIVGTLVTVIASPILALDIIFKGLKEDGDA